MSHEMGAADCIRRKSGGGHAQVCLSSSSRQNRRGRGIIGVGAARPWAPAPWRMATPWEGGKNREEAERVRFRPSPRAETVYGGLSTVMGGGRQW
jgi:hypothetical protein